MALTLLLFISAAALQFATNVSPVPVQQLPMYIISQDDGDATSTCPKEKAVVTRQKIATAIRDILQQFIVPRHQCGDGQWYRVAYLNMSDPSQQCPSVWREYTSDGIRLCAQPTSSRGRCPGTLYPVSRQYGRVCGRVIGYQFGSTDAFHSRLSNIDQAYVDGISITHGRPRNHIWTYAAASSSKKVVLRGHAPVLAATVLSLHYSLEAITTVSRPMMVVAIVLSTMSSFLMIHSGMVNSVTMRVHVALVPTLHHGSV